MRARIPSEDPHGGRSIYSPKSHKWTIGVKPTTNQPQRYRIKLHAIVRYTDYYKPNILKFKAIIYNSM